MSEYSTKIGEIEIVCPHCGYDKSYKKILFNNASEYGVCMKCGEITYNKVIKGLAGIEPSIECPYCHSTNTKKISSSSKVAKVALFGIFALPKASKQWHCNNCKSDF